MKIAERGMNNLDQRNSEWCRKPVPEMRWSMSEWLWVMKMVWPEWRSFNLYYTSTSHTLTFDEKSNIVDGFLIKFDDYSVVACFLDHLVRVYKMSWRKINSCTNRFSAFCALGSDR